jgi:hypothetical protein
MTTLDPRGELDFIRTAIALGQPVDVESLVDLAAAALDRIDAGECSKATEAEAREAVKKARESDLARFQAEHILGSICLDVEGAQALLAQPTVSKKAKQRAANILSFAAKKGYSHLKERKEALPK